MKSRLLSFLLLLSTVAFTDAGTTEVAVTSAPARLLVTPPPFPGALDPSFDLGAGPDGVVRSMIIQADGKLVIGGWFGNVAEVPRPWLARINGNGSLDANYAIGTGPDGGILAMAAQSDGKLIVAGEFTSFDGVARPRVARLLPDGRLDSTFNPTAGPNGSVWTVAIQPDGKIWIGGDFQSVGIVGLRGMARLLPNGTVDTSFNPVSSPNGVVRSIVVDAQGRTLVGGSFSSVGDVPRQNVARLGVNGLVDTTFSAGLPPGGMVQAIAVQPDGRILIGGVFSSANGLFPNQLARVMTDGSIDPSFNAGTGPDAGVSAIVVQPGGKVLIGGGFFTVDGRLRGRLARLHPDGRLDGIFTSIPGANDWVETIAVDASGDILIGGAFGFYDNVFRPHLARVLGRDPAPFPPVFLGSPESQTVLEGANLHLSSRVSAFPEPTLQWRFTDRDIPGATNDFLFLRNIRFTNSGTYTLVASNALGVATGAVTVVTVGPAPTFPGSVDIDFFAGSGPAGEVHAIALQADRRIMIGGRFASVDGSAQAGVARLNVDGSLDTRFVGRQGFVIDVAIDANQRIIAGGFFPTSVARLLENGQPDATYSVATVPPDFVHEIALLDDGRLLTAGASLISGNVQVRRYDTNGILDTNFVVQSTNPGSALAIVVQPDGRLLVGGRFTDIHGTAAGRVVRLLPDGGLDSSFLAGVGANERVNAIVRQPDGRILIAGQFTRVNGISRNRIARLNADGSLDPTFHPGLGPNNAINALALATDGQILIAGEFTAVSGISRGHVARLNADGSLDLVFDTSLGADNDVHDIVVNPDGSVLIGGEFETVARVPRQGIARLRGGGPAGVSPVILVPPTNQIVTAGEDVALTVLASGVPAVTYQWQLDGVDIPGANQWILTIPNVRATHGGAYRVTVSNTHGSVASGEATLSVLVPSRTAGKPDIDFYTGAGPNDRVTAILPLSDGRIIIGGAFTAFDGTPRGRIARLARNGALDMTFAPGAGADGTVHALALQSDGKLLVGGAFARINGGARNRIARLHEDGSLDTTFDPGAGPDGDVFTAAVLPENRILIGGAFRTVSGQSNAAIARLDATGAVDPSFGSPFGSGSSVRALGFQSGHRIIAGGVMASAIGSFTALTRLTGTGEVDPTYNSNFGPNAGVLAIAIRGDDQILAGGFFIVAGGATHPRIAQLTPDGVSNLAFDPSLAANNIVRAVELQGDGRALLGGDFTGISGTVLHRIARLTTNGLVDATFNPGTGVTGGTSFTDEYGELIDETSVLAIAIEAGGSILVGGDFTRVNGVTRPGLARLYDHEPVSTIQIRPRTSAFVELFWEVGVLQQAPDLSGPWTDVPRAAGTYEVSLQGALRFFRLRLN